MMVLVSLTLLPALLGWVGDRIDVTTRAALIAVGLVVVGVFAGVAFGAAVIAGAAIILAVLVVAGSFILKGSLRQHVPHRKEPPKEQRFWYRWSRVVQHHPWRSALGAVAFLIILAIPLLSLRLGFGDYGNYPESQTVRRAYDLLAEGFGPGSNGPFYITVEGETATDPEAVEAFVGTLEETEGVAFVNTAPEDVDDLALVLLFPDGAPQDAETDDLVDTLRDDVIPATGVDAKVGGATAGSSDFAAYMGERMPWLLAVVLGLSFLLLMAVFRSLLVPLKAVIMNLLSVAAAYGVLVADLPVGLGDRG